MNFNSGGASIDCAPLPLEAREEKDNLTMQQKVISIETKKCCYCRRTLYTKSDQIVFNDKRAVCSACWDVMQANP